MASPTLKTLPRVKKDFLGKMALALLPIEKLKNKSRRGIPFEQEIHDFLSTTFNGYTALSGNTSGHWKDDRGRSFYGEHRAYKVAIPDEESLAGFEVFLAGLAFELGEECIYMEIGAEILLIYAQEIQ
jgi:hypothetical protein